MIKGYVFFFLMFALFFSSLAFSLTSQASAKDLLVISDIDDTIKLSHVLRKRSASLRALDANSWFLGMNSLYQLIKNDNPKAYFAYISAAPEFLLENTHQKLLSNGQFPLGEYIARDRFISSLNHKLIAIRKLLTERRPKTVIFIGDNGERDPVVYNQITQEFKNSGIQFHTFIRMVYSSQNVDYVSKLHPLSVGQFVFVTPVEMGLELRKRALINEASMSWLVNTLIDFIEHETPDHRFGVLAFPTFLDCRGYKWPFINQPGIITPVNLDPLSQQKLMRLISKISYRCSKSFSSHDD